MRTRFQTAIVEAMGCDAASLGTPGVSVAGDPGRADNQVTAGYLIADHFFVTCDPAVESLLVDATSRMAPTLGAWRSLAVSLQGELLGSGVMKVLGAGGLADSMRTADGYALRPLDLVADRSLIERFIESNSPDDLDEAEIELDDLDETIDVALDAEGHIVSWASTRPFDMSSDFGDIAVVTHPDHRGRGLGRAVVASVCVRMQQAGLEPLYRCDVDNVGSRALSASLGFELATELCAYRFPTD